MELLRAPDGAVVKEGSSSGKQLRRTKQRHLAAREQCSHVRPFKDIYHQCPEHAPITFLEHHGALMKEEALMATTGICMALGRI